MAPRALLALALVTTAATVRADEARARAIYHQGETAFALGHFDEAISRFEAAYHESPRPALLWNLAQAHRRQFDLDHDPAHLRRARELLRNYRSSIADPNEQAEALRLEEDCAAKLAVVAPGTAPPPPVPLYKRWWLWTGIAAVALLAAGGITLGLVFSEGGSPPPTLLGDFGVSF